MAAPKQKLRIIPRLDIKGPNLVKGIHLEGLRVLGAPADFARAYYEQGADELIFMDVVASLYERNSLHHIIETAAQNIFIPITVGGGLRTIADIRAVLNAGADKVAINTAAVRDPEFVRAAVQEFGSSTIIGVIEAIKDHDSYYCFVDNGREATGLEASARARQLQEMGVGEILLTSVDREGTGAGLDYELIDLIMREATVPVVVHGGADNAANIAALCARLPISGVAIASVFHYHICEEQRLRGTYEGFASKRDEGNFDFLKRGRKSARIQSHSISALKSSLYDAGIPLRRCWT